MNGCWPGTNAISRKIGNEASSSKKLFVVDRAHSVSTSLTFSCSYSLSLSLSNRGSPLALLEKLAEGGWKGLVDAGTSWRRLGGKRRWIEAGRRQTRVQNPARPGRVDSLANFQIYTLAVRSRAACFGRREGRRERERGRGAGGQLRGRMGHARDPRLLTPYNARFSCARVRVHVWDQCLQELYLCRMIPVLSGKFSFRERANRLKLRSPPATNIGAGREALAKTKPCSLVRSRFTPTITRARTKTYTWILAPWISRSCFLALVVRNLWKVILINIISSLRSLNEARVIETIASWT